MEDSQARDTVLYQDAVVCV